MTESGRQVIVVGAGASGLMAAGVAAGRGRRVTLLERNRSVGRKLLISGKGRCNLANETDIDGLMANIPGNPKFLRSAFYAFGPRETLAFFAALGVPLKTERGGRVFPESDDAEDVVRALANYCRKNGVKLKTETVARRLLTSEGRLTGVLLEDNAFLPAEAVILATGGASYPGYRFHR